MNAPGSLLCAIATRRISAEIGRYLRPISLAISVISNGDICCPLSLARRDLSSDRNASVGSSCPARSINSMLPFDDI